MAGIDPISNVANAAEGIMGTVAGIIEHFIPDKSKAAEAAQAIQFELVKQMGEQNKGQLEINTAEAGNPNVFVSGWRPFIGWVCGFSLAWTFFLEPICQYFAVLLGSTVTFPTLGNEALLTLTINLLGLGAMHSFDKYQGTTPPSGTVVTVKEVRKATPVK
jgi:hypothetical protein